MESACRLPDGSVSSILYPDKTQCPYGFLEDYAFMDRVGSILWYDFGGMQYVGKLDDWINKAESLLKLTLEHFKKTQALQVFL